MRTKLFIVMSLGLLIGTRLLHLLNTSHYYLINQDSFYFHWIAGTHNIPLRSSGLSYLLSISPDLMSILLPLILSLLTALILYAYTRHLYSHQAALCTVFCFAICIPAIFIGSAGNVDRDSLEVLLITPILFSLYFSFDNKAWLIVAATLLALLTVLWMWVAIPIVAILSISVFFSRYKDNLYSLLIFGAVVITSCIVAATHWSSVSSLFSQSIYELKAFDVTGLFLYIPLILPLGYGMLILHREKPKHSKLLLSMLLFNLCLGTAMSRLQLFLIAPVCIVSGIGMWRFYVDNRGEQIELS